MATDERIPVILDTDIGSDIDDAVCLAYLLKQPRCELVGITTVSGEPLKRAMMADAVCRAAGRKNVPIFAGAEEPMLVRQKQGECPQAGVLDRFTHRKDFSPNEAVAFLRETIRRRPGEITLLAIGPLTNIGLLFATDREIPRLLKQLVMMCGVFTNRLAGVGPVEWNAICDPHATAIVYGAPAPKSISIGLEVTCRCHMPADECRRRLRGGPLDVVAAAAEVWFASGRKQITFHDPLAGACVFHPDICGYLDGQVDVELASDRVCGMTHFSASGPAKPHSVAVEVDSASFFREYFGIVSAKPRRNPARPRKRQGRPRP